MNAPRPRITHDDGVPPPPGPRLTTPPEPADDGCPLGRVLQSALTEWRDTLQRIADGAHATQDVLTRLADDVQALRAEDALRRELQAECRELREQFHERETLGPVLRTLIAQADRCRQNMSSLRDLVRGRSPTDEESVEGVRIAFDTLKGDLAEIEAALATFGVEPFKDLARHFAPQHQKCVERIVTHDERQANCIAQRVYPGYRRHGAVLQPERVKVYVYEPEPSQLA